MPQNVHRASDLEPGQIYEDCAYHPCLCLGVEDDDVWGISLVDGSYPRSCSIQNCGVRRLTLAEAWQWRRSGPPDVELSGKHRWWDPGARDASRPTV